MDFNDKLIWYIFCINMFFYFDFDLFIFVFKVWVVICEICGGEDCIDLVFKYWKDFFIVNFGILEGENKFVFFENFFEWYVDGDFFVYYFDSREQGLFVIFLFIDIEYYGGGIYICFFVIFKIVKYLYENLVGVCLRMEFCGVLNFNQ